jgi:Zn-dependent protease with chaperone function
MPTFEPTPQSDLSTSLWRPWSAAEREDFFEAIARHRRAAWRVTAVCALAYVFLALVVAILMAPLLYSVLGLALDIVNLVIPTPDLLHDAGRAIDSLADSRATPSAAYMLKLMALAAAPGLALMGLAAVVLRRALTRSALYNPDKPVGRVANTQVLAEQRFSNTIEEMALAAAIPPPRALVLEGGANAAAFGPDEQHATVLVSTRLIESLNREQMQGVAGYLIASAADGDMKIGLRTALVLGLFALMARVSSGWTDRAAFVSTRKLLRALIAPTTSNLDFVLSQLSDPFVADSPGRKEDNTPELTNAPPTLLPHTGDRPTPGDSARSSPGGAQPTSGKLTWKEWMLMPLMGPVVLSGFLSGLVNSMMLGPAVALAWRQRKYMADATAVRLTRDPNALASALSAISGAGGSLETASWADHLCVVDPGSKREASLLFGSFVSIFPSLQRRIDALVRMGAEERFLPTRRYRLPLPALILIAVLSAIIGFLLVVVVVLLIWVSAALSGLFTLFPTALLHALLR